MQRAWSKKFLSSLLVVTLILTSGILVPFEAKASVTVNNENELRQALASNDSEIEIGSDITVLNGTFDISRPVVIKGNNHSIILGSTIENLFHIHNTNGVNFENIVLNGNGKGRLIFANGAKINFLSATLTKGSTQNLQENYVNQGNNKVKNMQHYQGGAIYSDGSTISLVDTIVSENRTKTDVPIGDNQVGAPSPSGGGIYLGSVSVLNVTGGKFLNNKTGGMANGVPGPNGEGGAIKVEGGSTLNINTPETTNKLTTLFEGNSNDSLVSNGGRQGGSIEVTDATANIFGATFKISGPFDTGGAIKFEGGTGLIKNSEFTILPNKGVVGNAGGAITSENSNLTIEDSNFNTGLGSRVAEAGGLIQVTSAGTFTMKRSTLTGSGYEWNQNQYQVSKFGGGISFYNATNARALIEDSTIQNFSVEISGGGIGLNTQLSETGITPGSTDLTLRNTKLLNNLSYTWSNTNYGGGIFLGKGNTVVMDGGQISSGPYSAAAGAIYNEGSLTISGGAKIINNHAYYEVPGILNDGYLKVDEATFSGNNSDYGWTGNTHILTTSSNHKEMIGANIYAKKDVIITPNATFENGDIRVIDKQSAIILTGTLNKKIDVSISEVEKTTGATNLSRKLKENAKRYIGYTVAKGDGTYEPVKSDANFLNYVSLDKTAHETKQGETIIAAYDDQTSRGKWDYVYNPVDKTVVLGQRAELIYDANKINFSGAKFADNSDIKTQIYDIYSSVAPWSNPIQLTKISEIPTADDGYVFNNWYKAKRSKALIAKRPEVNLFNFERNYFTNSTEPIVTPLLDIDNYIEVYAGYLASKYKVSYKFKKADDVTIALPSEINNYLPSDDNEYTSGTEVSAKVVTTTSYVDNTNGGTWKFVSWDSDRKTIGNENIVFTGTWTFEKKTKYKVSYKFKKAD